MAALGPVSPPARGVSEPVAGAARRALTDFLAAASVLALLSPPCDPAAASGFSSSGNASAAGSEGGALLREMTVSKTDFGVPAWAKACPWRPHPKPKTHTQPMSNNCCSLNTQARSRHSTARPRISITDLAFGGMLSPRPESRLKPIGYSHFFQIADPNVGVPLGSRAASQRLISLLPSIGRTRTSLCRSVATVTVLARRLVGAALWSAGQALKRSTR